ncbi:hypothetical protein B0O99DRAFT_265072 [Bisporella sp. PMI_857]|nr:hypothetical protein B0O99DRAFT_265072 [Bisporella sp. PMI_857]
MKSKLLYIVALFTASVLAVVPNTTDTKWLYAGCYFAPAGHMLDHFTAQNLTTTSIMSCFEACADVRFAALGAGQCYCAKEIIATLKPNADDSNCTVPCGIDGADACGGPLSLEMREPVSLSLYDSLPPVPISYPGWKYDGCVQHNSMVKNLTHLATIGELTVNRCLAVCDVSPVEYVFAGVSGDSCFCGGKNSVTKAPQYVKDDYNTCNFPCAGNKAQACGGTFAGYDGAVSFYERESGPSDASSIDPNQTGQLMTRTVQHAEATSVTTGTDGNPTPVITSSSKGSQETKKSDAGAVRIGGEILAGMVGLLAVL